MRSAPTGRAATDFRPPRAPDVDVEPGGAQRRVGRDRRLQRLLRVALRPRDGQRAGRNGRATRVTFPGSDVEAELVIGLDDVLRGGKRRITLPATAALTSRSARRTRRHGVAPGRPGRARLERRAARGPLPAAAGGPHPRYRMAGDDLEMDLPLWPWQAALGGAVKVDTPDGEVTLKVPPGSQSGRRLRLRGRGLPRRTARAAISMRSSGSWCRRSRRRPSAGLRGAAPGQHGPGRQAGSRLMAMRWRIPRALHCA
jgi:hypothetical protein